MSVGWRGAKILCLDMGRYGRVWDDMGLSDKGSRGLLFFVALPSSLHDEKFSTTPPSKPLSRNQDTLTHPNNCKGRRV
jgi:hypothetical protein